MPLKKHFVSLIVIQLALNIITSYPAKAATHNRTDHNGASHNRTNAASAQSKVKNILAFLRAKAWVDEAAATKLKNFTASPDMPDRLYTCLSISPDDQSCEVPAEALQSKVSMAYASEERRGQPDVLVLASRTATDVHIYRVSTRTGALERVVMLSKVMNGDRMETKLELLENKDTAVILDFQAQLDYWNDKYQKWAALRNNFSHGPVGGVAVRN
jgi:hypothetical protein